MTLCLNVDWPSTQVALKLHDIHPWKDLPAMRGGSLPRKISMPLLCDESDSYFYSRPRQIRTIFETVPLKLTNTNGVSAVYKAMGWILWGRQKERRACLPRGMVCEEGRADRARQQATRSTIKGVPVKGTCEYRGALEGQRLLKLCSGVRQRALATPSDPPSCVTLGTFFPFSMLVFLVPSLIGFS